MITLLGKNGTLRRGLLVVDMVKEIKKANRRQAEDRTKAPQYMAIKPAVKVSIAQPNAPKELNRPRRSPDS